jgi:hypothetical protein
MQSWKREELHWHQDCSNKSGLCAALGNNVFAYGQRAAADQMQTSWEKLVQFMGTNYGQDISKQWATEQDPGHAYQTSPYSRSLGKTCHLRTDGSHQTREHTKGPLIEVSHPGSCSCTWSRPWCTYATCNFG